MPVVRARDNAQRFLIESCDVRGQIVQLDDTWREVLARVDYPPHVRTLLGEAFVAAVLLAGTIKFEGRMTFQIRGEGPVRLLVVQVTADRRVRGLARWAEDASEAVNEGDKTADAASDASANANANAETKTKTKTKTNTSTSRPPGNSRTSAGGIWPRDPRPQTAVVKRAESDSTCYLTMSCQSSCSSQKSSSLSSATFF